MQTNDPYPPRFSFGNMYNDVWNGSLLGVGVSLLNPFFYAKNMRMIQAPFSIRHCFRGTVINATTSIPQAAVQITTMQLMMRALYPDKGEKDLTDTQNLLRATVAGSVSALFTVPVELIVQNIQKLKQDGYHSARICKEVVKVNGLRGLMGGSGALIGREIIYVVSYKILAEKISRIFAHLFSPSPVTDLVAAGTAGAVGGAITTPLDFMRAIKQDQAIKRRPQSYRQIIASIGVKGLFRGVAERSLAIALACIVMNQGSKYFYD